MNTRYILSIAMAAVLTGCATKPQQHTDNHRHLLPISCRSNEPCFTSEAYPATSSYYSDTYSIPQSDAPVSTYPIAPSSGLVEVPVIVPTFDVQGGRESGGASLNNSVHKHHRPAQPGYPRNPARQKEDEQDQSRERHSHHPEMTGEDTLQTTPTLDALGSTTTEHQGAHQRHHKPVTDNDTPINATVRSESGDNRSRERSQDGNRWGGSSSSALPSSSSESNHHSSSRTEVSPSPASSAGSSSTYSSSSSGLSSSGTGSSSSGLPSSGTGSSSSGLSSSGAGSNSSGSSSSGTGSSLSGSSSSGTGSSSSGSSSSGTGSSSSGLSSSGTGSSSSGSSSSGHSDNSEHRGHHKH